MVILWLDFLLDVGKFSVISIFKIPRSVRMKPFADTFPAPCRGEQCPSQCSGESKKINT